jgi:serine/threonine protein kinase
MLMHGVRAEHHMSERPTRFAEAGPLPFHIPEHEIIALIAAGAYGEVWLARNAVGTLRAVKIVRRDRHKSVESFEREFRGLQKFEPISRTHEGLVDVLTLGLFDDGAGFYYVMELADNALAEGGPRKADSSGANDYSPKTLRAELEIRGALPADQVISLGLKLSRTLAHLHSHGLVHRDIKPSNIIFVGGEPKLADIGLVTDLGDNCSIVGTEGYLPPEGPGSAQADLYSLGTVFYEVLTGNDRRNYPSLPNGFRQEKQNQKGITTGQGPSDQRLRAELNRIILHACESDARRRYRSATEMHRDLKLIAMGRAVPSRNRSRLLVLGGVVAVVLIALATGVGHFGLRGSLPLNNPESAKYSGNAEADTLYDSAEHWYL